MNTKSLVALLTLIAAVSGDRIKSFSPNPVNKVFVQPKARNIEDVLEPRDAAVKFVAKQFNLKPTDYAIKNIVPTKHNGLTHIYLKQMINGTEVSNGDMNLNIDSKGQIISYGSSFLPLNKTTLAKSQLWPRTRAVAPAKAFAPVAKQLNQAVPTNIKETAHNIDGSRSSYVLHNIPFAKNGVKVEQAYVQNSDGLLESTWRMVVDTGSDWVNVHVRADGSKVVALTNWVNDVDYDVIKLGDNDLGRSQRTLIKDPADKNASPQGWHYLPNNSTIPDPNFKKPPPPVVTKPPTAPAPVPVPVPSDPKKPASTKKPKQRSVKVAALAAAAKANTTNTNVGITTTSATADSGTTIGNNVYAQENWEGADNYLNNHRPVVSNDDYNFPLDLTKEPKESIDAAVTNLFYWNNVMHDVSYQYEFNEVSGNFQADNFGKGGVGGDFVIANAQDGSGTDNANFATPPDGQNGRMRMYVFTSTTPNRDGDFVSDIVSHEYTHGISNRLTGGPANADCLDGMESGGMGEGWSDFMAISLQMRSTDTRTKNMGVGEYINNGTTIRSFYYSTNMTTNPETYDYINKDDYQEVHMIGEVWCNILYEVFWNTVEAVGKFNDNVYSADLTSGNTLAIQNVIDGLKMQPCNPTFITARDAILQAEKANTGGKYACAIWKAFAKRGVGFGASSNSTMDASSVKADTTLPPQCQ